MATDSKFLCKIGYDPRLAKHCRMKVTGDVTESHRTISLLFYYIIIIILFHLSSRVINKSEKKEILVYLELYENAP